MAQQQDDESDGVFRLEGSSGAQKGGLVIMKKGPASDSNQHEFKQPSAVARQSLLGLDKLASIKRAEAAASASDKDEHQQRNRRQYRDRQDETPSHTGGVSNDYVKKMKDRRDNERGFYASSKDNDHHSGIILVITFSIPRELHCMTLTSFDSVGLPNSHF